MKKFYSTSKISENLRETPEGYLICIGVPIARTGEMDYGPGETPLEVGDAGVVKVTRDEDEVFSPKTMASFEGKAVTITHPNEFVGPDNWKELCKGIVQNVRRGEGEQKDDLIADLLIMDKMAINLVKNGLREVSCGYEAEYKETGEGQGIQTKIVGNHLALVEAGRAGSAYAIRDHKYKGENKMSLGEKIKAIFAKAQDEAMEVAKDADEDKDKDKDKGKGKGKDEDKEKSKDAQSYDDLVKMVKDLGEKISAMAPKDEEKKDDKKDDKKSDDADEDKKDDDKKSDDADEGAGLEDRLKALESAVAKLLEKKAGDEDGSVIEDEEGDKSEDDDFEETGDTASRAEILAPGIEMGKEVKAKALKAAYGTKEGKKAIDAITGGKAPAYDSKEKVDMLFVAASELLKVQRESQMSATKRSKNKVGDSVAGPMTAEKMNEINSKHYKRN